MKHQIPPGPWHVREHRTSLGVNGGEGDLNIATITLGYNRDNRRGEKEAIAKAIAALPELIETLIAARAYVHHGKGTLAELLPQMDATLKQAGIEP